MKSVNLILIGVMCAAAASLLMISLAAYADLTPGLNYSGKIGTAANFTSPINAVGAETLLCSTQGTAAKQQYWQNFGFGIPSSATLNGIKVTLLASLDAGSETWTVYLRPNQTASSSSGRTAVVNNNNACGVTQGTFTFGGATDMWGTSLTPAQVNTADFGVLISLPAGATTRRINYIVMEINYTLPTSTTTTTVTSTTTLTSTTTVTANVTNTINVTSTITSTVTNTVTSTFNTTVTYNATVTSTSTVTSTFNTTVTSTVNVTSTFSVYNSTTTITNTTTITAAVCSALLCANVDYYGEQSPWWIMGVLIGAMFGAVIVIARKRRSNN